MPQPNKTIVALRIEVPSYRGLILGVPRLVEILRQHQASASFFLALGPNRISSRSPAIPYKPDIGRRARNVLQALGETGYETGINAWDAAAWCRRIQTISAHLRPQNPWIEEQIDRAEARYIELFGKNATAYAAPAWQIDRHALRLMQRKNFLYTSNTRGKYPYIPVWQAEPVLCPEIPTTLPTVDELIGQKGIHKGNVAEYLLAVTSNTRINHPHFAGHVFSLDAEQAEDSHFLQAFEQLISGWRQQKWKVTTLAEIARQIHLEHLPRHFIHTGRISGCKTEVAMQGADFTQG